MTRRRPMTPARRERILKRDDYTCHICLLPIDPVRQAWDVEHPIALGLGGADDDSNWRPAHNSCHYFKTYDDWQRMKKADRQHAKHMGAKTRKSKPMLGSRASPLKKKLSGEVVRRAELEEGK